MSSQPEIWRVSTVEGVFQADFETLKQWIAEGCVLPTDKVSKGNLSWIEAGRVPKLKGAFNGEPAPVSEPINTSFETFVESNFGSTNPPQSYSPPSTTWVEPAPIPVPISSATACHNHPEADPAYVCRMCAAVFCKTCPKFVGKVPVCALCGDLCHEYRALTEKKERAQLQRSGFGTEDLMRAIRYPLQHKTALFGGALIYGLLLLAGRRGSACAWVIMFGCISQVITQVAWGRLNRSFMPDFSEFSGWDDLFLPGFLGVGVTIVSWGPAIVLVFALIFGGLSGDDMTSSSFAGGDHGAESIQSEDLSVLTDPNADPAKLEEANKKLQQLRPGAGIAREAEASRAEASDPAGPLSYIWPYLRARFSMALLFLLFIVWGLFYYPMALTVAGYTQSFGSVINPLVGLDTIRRMGATYFKAFAMVMAVYAVAFILAVIVYAVTSPLALPFMGNVIGNFMNATFTFYFNLVVACILGLSLFKCADRLDISVD